MCLESWTIELEGETCARKRMNGWAGGFYRDLADESCMCSCDMCIFLDLQLWNDCAGVPACLSKLGVCNGQREGQRGMASAQETCSLSFAHGYFCSLK